MRLFDRFWYGPLCDPISAVTAGVGAVGSIIGGVVGGNAASKAAKIQQQNATHVADMAETAAGNAQNAENTAVAQSNGTLSDVFGQQQQNLQPYLTAGVTGVNSLTAALAPGGSLTQQFTAPTAAEAAATPGYQFQLDQGTQALQRSLAATGGIQSGGAAKSITQYAQGLASTNYQNAYNNAANTFQMSRNNTYQGLTALTGVGQNAAQQFNAAAQNYGNTTSANNLTAAQYSGNAGLQGVQIAGSALTGGANAQSSAAIGQGNAINTAISGATSVLGNAAQDYSITQALNPYFGSAVPTAGPTALNSFGLTSATTLPATQPYAPPAAPPPSYTPYTLTQGGY